MPWNIRSKIRIWSLLSGSGNKDLDPSYFHIRNFYASVTLAFLQEVWVLLGLLVKIFLLYLF